VSGQQRPDRDIDRLLSDWMADAAPRRVPDGVLEDAFARTASSRQRRRTPIDGLLSRPKGSRLLIAVPVALAIAAAGVYIAGHRSQDQLQPSPSPIATLATTPAPASLSPSPSAEPTAAAPSANVAPAQMGYSGLGSSLGSVGGATPVTLPDGSILFVGGGIGMDSSGFAISAGSVERFDPATMQFASAGRLRSQRMFPYVAPLPDGTVFVAGGDPTNGATASAERFDPSTGQSAALPDMPGPRRQGTATVLPDGRVLLAGGSDANGNLLGTSLLFDPATNSFTPTGSLHDPRMLASAVGLANGDVLVAGGVDAKGPTTSAELYDATTGTFSSVSSMAVARVLPALAVLPDGSVLVVSPDSKEAERFDPATGRFTSAGTMASPHSVAVTLADGRVLVAGGGTATPEVFDPSTSTFAPTRPMASSGDVAAAVLLPDGSVLLARGGGDPSEVLDLGGVGGAPGASPSPSPTPSASGAPQVPNACRLLTSAQVRSATGLSPGKADPTGSGPGESDCAWHGGAVKVSIRPLDPAAWTELNANPSYTPVTGLGDGAVAGGGSLFLHNGAWTVEIAVSPPGSPSPASILSAEVKLGRALLATLT
jgi:hypothetical protein